MDCIVDVVVLSELLDNQIILAFLNLTFLAFLLLGLKGIGVCYDVDCIDLCDVLLLHYRLDSLLLSSLAPFLLHLCPVQAQELKQADQHVETREEDHGPSNIRSCIRVTYKFSRARQMVVGE